jgi:WD40 repeat protein
MDFSRDGKLLAVITASSTVLTYDVPARKLVQSFVAYPGNSATGIALCPDARTVAVINNGREPARVFRIEDAVQIATLAYTEGVSLVENAAWSPAGDILAFVTGAPRTLHLWLPFIPGQHETVMKLDSYADSLAFSPDGKNLAVGIGPNVVVFAVNR